MAGLDAFVIVLPIAGDEAVEEGTGRGEAWEGDVKLRDWRRGGGGGGVVECVGVEDGWCYVPGRRFREGQRGRWRVDWRSGGYGWASMFHGRRRRGCAEDQGAGRWRMW